MRARNNGTPVARRPQGGRGAPALAASSCAIAALLGGGPASTETLSPILQQALPGVAGKSMTVVTVDFVPASRAIPHRHGQALVFAYVLKGVVRSQIEGQPVMTYVAGQSWTEPPGAHHVLTENPSATEPARLLVVFVAATGATLKVDDPRAGAK